MTRAQESRTIEETGGAPRVAIIGSRGITSLRLLEEAMAQAQAEGLTIGLVLSGGARGVDRLGETWARRHQVPLRIIAPDWERYGRRAGLLRNVTLIGQADAVVALHSGTPGTQHALGIARQRKLPVWEFRPTPQGLYCTDHPQQEEP